MVEWHIEMEMFDVRRTMRFTLVAASLSKAKQAVLQEFRKYSPSTRNLYLEAKGDGVYAVVSHLTDVGQVMFQRIDNR
ncbi:MAG TPA: hypothetical protein ENN81_05040 [Phycisphaerales bacterium]|nr:hypothetical protein [Phycisphaerales bacterium]